jgi:hypothetical protein
MSDTPETDDQPIIYAMNDNGYQVPCVDIDFARKLERERDEAREAFVIATDQMVQAQCKTREALRERDEAREHLREIKEYGTEEINAAVELRQKLATALVERDEWKNKAYSHATDYTLMEAKCFRLEQELKEIHSNQSVIIKHYDKLKS